MIAACPEGSWGAEFHPDLEGMDEVEDLDEGDPSNLERR